FDASGFVDELKEAYSASESESTGSADSEITELSVAVERGLQPVCEFMFKQVAKNPQDLALFIEIADLEPPNNPSDVPTSVLAPALILGEMRIAFQLGFIIYIPFVNH
ncbi:MAG: hypothetical protein VCC01_02085, partial [Candidatus Hydrogenedentota bacterium]